MESTAEIEPSPQKVDTPINSPNGSSKKVIYIVGCSVGLIVLLGLCCVLVPALTLPAVQQMRAAAQRTVAAGNGRQLGLAIQDYYETHGKFPSASGAEGGSEMQSWRVRILPYIMQDAVYQEYDMGQSYDHSSNSIVKGLYIPTFQSPRGESTLDDTTHFVAVVGPNTVLTTDGKKIQRSDIKDGLTKTIMLIEYRESTLPWYQPGDVSVDEAIDIIQNADSSGTVAIFADGSYSMIPPSISEKDLRALFTRNGGETISEEYLPSYDE